MMKRLAVKNEIIAGVGEFVGTALFLFLGELTIKTAIVSQTQAQLQTNTATSNGLDVALANPTLLYISVGMGLALLSTAWVFYRITGGLFNPAITLALWLCGAVSSIRAIILVFAQYAGGIAASGMVAAMTPGGGISQAITTLQQGVNYAQGLWIEALLTAALVFTVLMLAAEKHKATFMAPIGIGLVLFVCQLAGTLWTGCGMNPARALGPSVISASFPVYHWIYHVGPIIGALISTALYISLKALDYGSVVLGQDSDKAGATEPIPIHRRMMHARFGFSRSQREAMKAAGLTATQVNDLEAQMVAVAEPTAIDRAATPINDQPHADVEKVGFGSGMHSSVQNTGGIGQTRADRGDGTGALAPTFTEDELLARPVNDRRPTATLSPMSAQAQQTGGIEAPGTHAPGILRNVLQSRKSYVEPAATEKI